MSQPPPNPNPTPAEHYTSISDRLNTLERNNSAILTRLEALTDTMTIIESQMRYVEAKLNGVRLDVADVNDRVRDAQETVGHVREEVKRAANDPAVQNTYHFYASGTVNNNTIEIREISEQHQ